jgi:23S rRNA (adenine2503-C2)-methyltransferase
VRELVSDLGYDRDSAHAAFSSIWRDVVGSPMRIECIPEDLRRRLDDVGYLPRLELRSQARSPDGTRKLTWGLCDGACIESVLVPGDGSHALYIATQVGCAMGCRFCRTAEHGLVRHLGASEIVLQVAQARELLGPDEHIGSIITLGTGEPLHNLANVGGALDIILDPLALGFDPGAVTVSTVGLLHRMRRFAEHYPVNLAVSLNATTEDQRTAIMPVNRRYRMRELLEVCRSLAPTIRARMVFQYVMVDGLNASLEDAERLLELVGDLAVRIELLPCNPHTGHDMRAPAPANVAAFVAHLARHGIPCSVRADRGADIAAACGQLGAARLVDGPGDRGYSAPASPTSHGH